MLSIQEQYEHYDFYVDNCTDDEIPINFNIWKQEYLPKLEEIYKQKRWVVQRNGKTITSIYTEWEMARLFLQSHISMPIYKELKIVELYK